MADKLPRPHHQLAETIGHRFSGEEFLNRALTHSSFVDSKSPERPQNFERLEFVGDRVLGLVIAELLYKAFPGSDEGGLATRYNMLVRKDTCARVAAKIELGNYIQMSAGEAEAGGRHKKAILGNACESLIAAIYMDGGLEAARSFIHRFWGDYVEEVANPPQDAKTALQEWAQAKGLAPPTYSVENKEGPDHAPRFTIRVSVEGYDPETAAGGSKRLAEQSAATQVLLREGVWHDD